jgi:hypothetical protein
MQSEVGIMGYKEKLWHVETTSYVELLKKAIIGIQVEITKIWRQIQDESRDGRWRSTRCG